MERREDLLNKLLEDTDVFGGDCSDYEAEGEQNLHPHRGSEKEDSFSLPPASVGRRKKKSTKSTYKLRKAEVEQIHSESQRVLREAPINLPRFQPSVKSLDSFLSKVRSRQASIASHSQSGGMPIKAHTDKLIFTTPSLTPGPSPRLFSTTSSTISHAQPTRLSLTTPTTCPPSLAISTPIPAPKLADRDSFDYPIEPLQGVQLLEWRLLAQMDSTSKCASREVGGSKSSGVTSFLLDDAPARLKAKPGVVREEWKKAMKQQLSQVTQERVHAQRVLIQEQKKYDEEEEEAEETEPDTSDEELEFAEALEKAASGEMSDACSDLDKEEGVTGRGGVSESSHDMEEEEEEIFQARLSSRRMRTSRLIDSDDSDGNGGEEEMETKGDAGSWSEHTFEKTSSFPRLNSDEVTGSEALLPPLKPLLSISSASAERVTESSVLANGDPGSHELVVSGSLSSTGEVEGCNLHAYCGKGMDDSGAGGMQPRDMGKEGVILQKEEAEEDGDNKKITNLLLDITTNVDSLETSFQWGQSLHPVAQPPPPTIPPSAEDGEGSGGMFSQARPDTPSTQDILDDGSQWMDTPIHATPILDSLVEGETQSQFLDAEGFMFYKEKQSSPGLALLVTLATEDSPDDDILQLCSGGFPDAIPSYKTTPTSSSSSSECEDDSCVGGDPRCPLGVEQRGVPAMADSDVGPTSSIQARGEGGKESSNLSTVSGPCAFSQQRVCNGGLGGNVSSEEEDNAVLRWAHRHQHGMDNVKDGAGTRGDVVGNGSGMLEPMENEEEDMDMPLIMRSREVVNRPRGHTKAERLAEFVESEAELSGEDVGSDEEEEEEEDEEDLLYAEEEEKREELLLSKTELWEQVSKAHMKLSTEDDKADLRDLKERFLKEGDLYEDGLALKNGFFRTRHFGQGSEAGSLELFSEGRASEEEEWGMAMGEGEEGGNGNHDVSKQRRDKLEREEFIKKCRGSLLDSFNEDSRSLLRIITDTSSQPHTLTPKTCRQHSLSSAGPQYKPCNSFLKRSKSIYTSSLQRANSSSTTTPSLDTPNIVGSRHFVFQKSNPVTHKDTNLVKSGMKRPPSKPPHNQETSAKKKHTHKPASCYSTTSVFNNLYQVR